jgi:hypothetical protein
VVLAGAGLIGPAWCDDTAFSEKTTVEDSRLAEVRGGFELPANLHASLSLERTAYVNGQQVANLRADIPDVAHMTVAQATALQNVAGGLIIQNGPNNSFNLSDLGPAATVIQNTLSDQHLLALTTLTVNVNTLGTYRDLNFHDALRDNLAGAQGVR